MDEAYRTRYGAGRALVLLCSLGALSPTQTSSELSFRGFMEVPSQRHD